MADFLDKKYDYLTSKHPECAKDIYLAISKQLQSLREEWVRDEREKLRDYLQSIHIAATEEQLRLVI